MKIKNLSQFKKAINEGRIFTILSHYIKPEFNGQRRQPSVIQTNGFYSIVPGEPENKISKANNGKGYWIEYGKASEWEFYPDKIIRKGVWEIVFE